MAEKKPVMYIFVNADLNMTKGKTIAQCCHITSIITEDIIRKGYEVAPPPSVYFTFMKWRQECTKIILKATTEQLEQLLKLENAYKFVDSCTCSKDDSHWFPDNSITVVAFAPSIEMSNIAKDYSLY